MQRKLKFVKQTVNSDEVDFILNLAGMGLSYDRIAKEVWGNDCCERDGSIRPNHISRIGYILREYDVRVKDYRNARNPEGKAVVAACRRGDDLLSLIRSKGERKLAKVS